MTTEKLQAITSYCTAIHNGCKALIEISKPISKSEDDAPTAYEINLFVMKVTKAQNELQDFIKSKYGTAPNQK